MNVCVMTVLKKMKIQKIKMFDTWIVGSGSEGHSEVIEYLMFNGHVIDSLSRIYWSMFAIVLIVGLSVYNEYIERMEQ